MTLPNERRMAVGRTWYFLCDLLDAKKTPRIPRKVRLQARELLKHYPSQYDMHDVVQTFGKEA